MSRFCFRKKKGNIDEITDAYSNLGRLSVAYARSLKIGGASMRFLLMRSKNLLAELTMKRICVAQDRFSVK